MSSQFFKGAIRSNAEHLLSVYSSKWIVSETGELRSTQLDAPILEAAIVQAVRVAVDLEDSEIQKCARTALKSYVKQKNIGLDVFEEILIREIENWKNKRPNQYWAASRCFFALDPGQSFEVQIGKLSATFSHQRPDFDFKPLEDRDGRMIAPDRNSDGAYVVMSLEARSEESALERAAGIVSVTFGALCFALQYGRRAIFRTPHEPVALAFPGKEILLFDAEKTRSDDFLFYHQTPSIVFTTKKDIPSRWAAISNLIELKGPAWSDFYAEVFSHYFDALAEFDEKSRIVKLWATAELLAGTQNQDAICSRLSSIIVDKEVAQFVFEVARQTRNRIAHSGALSHLNYEFSEIFRGAIDLAIVASFNRKIKSPNNWHEYLELVRAPYSSRILRTVSRAKKQLSRARAIYEAKD